MKRTLKTLLLVVVVLVVGAGAWKVSRIVGPILAIWSDIKRQANLPDPVRQEGDDYIFPIAGRTFQVPKQYVKGYSRSSKDGSLSDFTLHFLLPDLQGYSPELDAKFRRSGGGRGPEILEMVVFTDRRTEEEMNRHWFEWSYQSAKEYAVQEHLTDSQTSWLSEEVDWIQRKRKNGGGKDYYYHLVDSRVLKINKCNIAIRDYQSPGCWVTMSAGDYLSVHTWFNRNYLDNWVETHDRLKQLLLSFEETS